MFKIKILGSSSAGNCYIIETDYEILLLECGISWKNILKGLDYDIGKVVGCLSSHVHKDHCKSIKDVIDNGIDCYALKSTFRGLKNHRVHYIEPKNQFNVGGFTILSLEAQHDVPTVAFLICYGDEKILFLTDSYYFKYNIPGVTRILIEANYSEDILPELNPYEVRLLTSHMSLETCKKTLQSWDLSGCKDIALIHLSSRHADRSRFKKEIEELTGIRTYIAGPGLIIEEESD